jgi:putative SOS response-associated peptidase YedK
MCGRYASSLSAEAIARLFRTTGPPPNIEPSWNIAPSQQAPVVRRHPQTGERHLSLLRWGLLPSWTKDLARAARPINARAETIATSGMFRGAFHARRAIVPAEAFYEWHATGTDKQPYAIARVDGQPLAFAGLWEGHRGQDGDITRSFTIVTTDANDDIRALHHRMPLILEPPDWGIWLGDEPGDPASLLHASASGTLRFWKVGRTVNTPRNNGPELLAEIPSTDGL